MCQAINKRYICVLAAAYDKSLDLLGITRSIPVYSRSCCAAMCMLKTLLSVFGASMLSDSQRQHVEMQPYA